MCSPRAQAPAVGVGSLCAPRAPRVPLIRLLVSRATATHSLAPAFNVQYVTTSGPGSILMNLARVDIQNLIKTICTFH